MHTFNVEIVKDFMIHHSGGFMRAKGFFPYCSSKRDQFHTNVTKLFFFGLLLPKVLGIIVLSGSPEASVGLPLSYQDNWSLLILGILYVAAQGSGLP